jgi:hypothetical protein
MNEEQKKKLEEAWMNSHLELSYDTWVNGMENCYKETLRERLPDLAKTVTTESGLFNHLTSLKVFDRRTIETLQVIFLCLIFRCPCNDAYCENVRFLGPGHLVSFKNDNSRRGYNAPSCHVSFKLCVRST